MSHNDRTPAKGEGPAERFREVVAEYDHHITRGVLDAAKVLAGSGLGTPLPLPRGDKYPPPDDTTGNKPVIPAEDALSAIEDHDGNLALRLADNVIGLDVDEYGDKHGTRTMRGLVEKLGPLPDTYMSTSRGPETASGIHLYRVPAGRKWKGKPGADVEMIQHTHRYAVVAPSTAADRIYRWYSPDLDRCDPPNADDLPMLPSAWVDYLSRGHGPEVREVSSIGGLDAALEWLATEIPGYSEDMSGQMNRTTNPEKLADEMSGGAHDMMVSRVHEVVQLAAEGHHGLATALSRIHTAFFAEVLGGAGTDARRDLGSTSSEWERSVVDEVSKLRADIERGDVIISHVGGYTATDGEIDYTAFREKMFRRIASEIQLVDTREFDVNDTGRAEIFLGCLGDLIRPVLGGDDRVADWAYWDERQGVMRRLTTREVRGELWSPSVIASYKSTAESLAKTAVETEDAGNSDDAESLDRDAKAMFKAAVSAGNRSAMMPSLDQAHALHRDPIDPAEFDREDLTLGVTNGVLDLGDCASGGNPIVRKGRREDLILMTAAVPYVPDATHPLWDDYLATFLPDLELREYVQKVIGYAVLGRNPRRRMVFLQGGTSTGKSTMINAVQAALGEYAATVNSNAVFREKQEAGPMPELLAAFPRRIVFASEVGGRNRLHADVIKRLTGGDSITARALYSNVMVQRTPMFTPIIATNSAPTINDADAALSRRLLVLPFDHAVPIDAPDVDPVHTDPEALVAVLAWLVDGTHRYLIEGLDHDVPAIVAERKAEFVGQTSDFMRWRSDALRTVPASAEGPRIYPVYPKAAADDFAMWQATNGGGREKLTAAEVQGKLRDMFGPPTARRRVFNRGNGAQAKNVRGTYPGVSWTTKKRLGVDQ
ncbi:phage/plasmid primase, P4 family [Gordonia sp. DT101]|uniref:phage/plasmid primase, P4 family n=1 Tax=Gordonia sp. DT101 TaxID=3416545 RepID=UPI003CF66A91